MTRRRTRSAAGLFWRGPGHSRTALIVLAIVAGVATAAGVAGPRITNALLTADLQYEASNAGPTVNNLQSSVELSAGYTTVDVLPVWKQMPTIVSQDRARMSSALRSVSESGRYVGRSEGSPNGIPASGPPGAPSATIYSLSIEGNPQLRQDSVLDAGHWPTSVATFPSSAPTQVVIASAAAKTMHWSIGQTQTLTVSKGIAQKVVLVGTVRPRDATADYWQLDSLRSRTAVTYSRDDSVTYLHSVIWVDASSWPTIANGIGDDYVDIWFPILPNRLTVDNFSGVQTSAQRFLAATLQVKVDGASAPLLYATQLSSVLTAFGKTGGTANTLLSIFATGPLGVILAVLLLGVRLYLERRRTSFALLRARGATGLRLRATAALETATASIPGAIVGGVVGFVLTAGSLSILAVATIVIAALVIPVIAAITAGSAFGDAPRTRTRGAGRRAWMLELFVIALAVLSVIVLRARGLVPQGSGLSVDPLVVAAPLLVIVASCIVVLRVFPVVLSWIGRALRRTSGTVDYLGWATSTRVRGGLAWPLFSVVTGVSVAIFSLAFVSTERDGIQDAAISSVGADMNVSALVITPAQVRRIAALPGVAHVAPVGDAGSASLYDGKINAALYLVNPAQLALVEADAPASARPFASLIDAKAGTHRAAVAGGFASEGTTAAVDTGSETPITVGLTVLGSPPASFIESPQWMVMDDRALPASADLDPETTNVLIALAPGADITRVRAGVSRAAGTGATVTDVAAQVTQLRAAPIIGGVEGIALAIVLLSALMYVVCIILALAMRTGARIRLLATFRTLGFSRRQSTRLIAWELGPIAVAGILVGAIVGAILPVTLLSSINLAAYTGGSRPPLVIDPILVGGVMITFALAAAVATIIAATLARRTSPSAALRDGGDE